MTRWVVDASVAVKWFLPEVDAEAAQRLLQAQHELLAPDLLWAEVGNTLWKKWRQGEITAETAQGILRDIRTFPLQVHRTEMLLETAWDLAVQWQRSIYDSLYLAIAMTVTCQLVTADRRFYNALRDHLAPTYLLWVADVPAAEG